jgi:hypothetical protein
LSSRAQESKTKDISVHDHKKEETPAAKVVEPLFLDVNYTKGSRRKAGRRILIKAARFITYLCIDELYYASNIFFLFKKYIYIIRNAELAKLKQTIYLNLNS